MTSDQIRFDDGAAYEQMMGKWSRLAGDVFLDWLAPPPGLRWVDVGCGNGAFTEAIFARCRPAAVDGIDPSAGQIKYARERSGVGAASFVEGDAMALPYPDAGFDAAIMALVIFFVPDPAKGVAEMVRVVKPGGIVAAYAWDIPGGGFPLEPIVAELEALGHPPVRPPSMDAARAAALRALWAGAGLDAIEQREITISRSFGSFDELWAAYLKGSTVKSTIDKLTPGDLATVRSRLSARLPAAPDGRITYSARANAIKGRKPG